MGEGDTDLIHTAFNLDDFTRLDKRKKWRLINLFLAEFIATGMKMFLMCSAIQASLFGKDQPHLNVALGAGLAVGSVVMMFQHVSGPHINPAITLAAVILGHMSLPLWLFYVVAQCLGSTTALAIAGFILPPNLNEDKLQNPANKCCVVPFVGLTTSQILVTEMMATAVLVLAFCAAVDKRNADKHDSLSLKFGIVIIAIAIPMALYSGCGINPARSIGPAIYNNYWDRQWIYWLGPLAGSAIISFVYRFVFTQTIVADSSQEKDPSSVKLRSQIQQTYNDDV